MEIEKILELGKMGFTKDEILKLIGGEKAETKETVEPDKEKPKETKETQEKEKPEEKETPESKEMKEMRAQLEGLKKMLQTQAIQNSEQPKGQTVDDLLGVLIKG